MATTANLKALLTFDNDCFGVGPVTFGDLKVARLKSWFEAKYATELAAVGRPGAATANDFAALVFRRVAPDVLVWEEQKNIEAQQSAGTIVPDPMIGVDQ